MLSCSDIFWEDATDSEPKTKRISDRENRRSRRKSNDTSKIRNHTKNITVNKQEKTPLKNKSSTKVQKSILVPEKLVEGGDSVIKSDDGVTLKDLNPQDKQRIAHLIQELAKVGEEKENIVLALNDERHKFVMQVRQMEEEKRALMSKQQFLAEEVKQCQTLLQYYQNLITMQQTTLLAREESKAQSESSTNYEKPVESSSQMTESIITGTDEVTSDEIRVNDAYDEHTSNSSLTEDDVLQMTDQQYKSFLKKKKRLLKKEQENLRKLLLMKEGQEPELNQSPPVRNYVDKSTGPPSSLRKKSIPIQTLSPIPMKESVSYISPSKSISNSTPPKTLTSSNSSNSTLQQTRNSPEQILHLLTQDLETDSLYVTEELSRSKLPAHPSMQESNLRTSINVSTLQSALPCDDDSQILQDIFFVS
uniref:uncharacterized protein LOC120338874 n=1 Tax=Styela clava TaxID=7725 RepID=UPI00193A2249|nr:uncharacterized protein LOC120338874 [Styela clava]